MRKKRKTIVLLAAAALSLLLGLLLLQPEGRVRRFVAAHGEALEAGMAAGHGVPARIGIKYCNTWEGKHSMTEFILFSRGGTYYGCYHSPDDVPLAFQNADVELLANGPDSWVWQAEGDNHGATSKIRDKWYYFTASF